MSGAPSPRPAPPPSQALPGFRRILILLGCFFVCVQVNRSAGGVLANYLGGGGSARSLDPTDIGTVMGAMFFASAAAQLPTGLLFDRIGARATLVLMSLIACAGIALFAIADGVAGLALGRFLIGFGHGGVISGIYLVSMGWSSPEVTARSTAAVVGLGGGIGGVLATTPLAVSLDTFGLAATFGTLAAATLVMTLTIWAMVTDRPGIRHAAAAPAREPETLGQSLAGLIEVVRMPQLRRLYVMAICFSAPFMTIGGLWAGPYFREVQGMDVETASVMLLLLVIALHIGTFAYGPLIARFPSRRKLILSGVAVEIACLSVLAVWPTAPLILAIGILFLFACAAPFYVALAAHARAFVPPERTGRMLTSINLMGLTGIFVMQSATGALIDWIEHAGGGPEDGHHLVFISVIALLVVTAAVYARQPDRPDE